jgi:uncharacterized protein YjeT (DUF2065 family)
VNWSAFYLAIVLALVYVAIGLFYLYPAVYHPFSSDTVNETHAHLTYAGIALALAVCSVIAGRFTRPSPRG